jgi:hypothetical protein
MHYPARHLLTGALASLAMSVVPLGQASAATSMSLGVDYASGDYGTPDTTGTLSVPISMKHVAGAWTLRASLPYVRAEGTFNRNDGTTLAAKRTESGMGDLTVGVSYALIDNPDGYSFDIGGKAKLVTADTAKTLITSGESDYSIMVDMFRSFTKLAVFGTLGYSVKGEPVGVRYKNPFFTSLGVSMPLKSGHTLGASWDYRQQLTGGGDPISELTAFYSMKLSPGNKMQFYVVTGLSDGSPDLGGGIVLTHTY